MGVKKQVEKDFAKILFVNENLLQKEIAIRLKVTEKTVSKWVKDENWESLKISMLVTKDNQLTALYKQLEAISLEIINRPIVYDIPTFLLKPIKLKDSHGDEYLEFPKINPKDYPIKTGNVATTKDAAVIMQITTSIKKLETETNIGETVEVCKQLIQFIRFQDTDFANELTKYCDSFINQKMKK